MALRIYVVIYESYSKDLRENNTGANLYTWEATKNDEMLAYDMNIGCCVGAVVLDDCHSEFFRIETRQRYTQGTTYSLGLDYKCMFPNGNISLYRGRCI